MAEPGGGPGVTGTPMFFKTVNPIPTMGARFCPFLTTGTPKCFHLPASLCLTFTLKNFRFVISYLKSHLIKVVFGPNTCWGLSQNGLSIRSRSCKKKNEWKKCNGLHNGVKYLFSNLILQVSKGQLISKCPFGVNVWTKIPTKFFPGFLP